MSIELTLGELAYSAEDIRRKINLLQQGTTDCRDCKQMAQIRQFWECPACDMRAKKVGLYKRLLNKRMREMDLRTLIASGKLDSMHRYVLRLLLANTDFTLPTSILNNLHAWAYKR